MSEVRNVAGHFLASELQLKPEYACSVDQVRALDSAELQPERRRDRGMHPTDRSRSS